MQAFKVVLASSGAIYFCSLACARKHDYPPQDGEFVLESEFHRQERCANCETWLNDTTRSFTFQSVACGCDPPDASLICPNCESVHFLVKWLSSTHMWSSCCEGCGAIYFLRPNGTAELNVKGTAPRCPKCGASFALYYPVNEFDDVHHRSRDGERPMIRCAEIKNK